MKVGLNKKYYQQLVILGILLFIVAVFAFTTKDFLTSRNLLNIARQVSFVIVTGAGVSLLMIARQLDLSVGSTLALSGVICAMLSKGSVPLIFAIILGILVGLAVGLINGVMVSKLKITSFIATLGTMYMVRGLTFIITDAKTVREGLPDTFTSLGRGTLGPVPIPMIIFIFVVVVFIILEKKSLLGKYSIAIGGNETASVLSGIKTNSVIILLYALVGCLAGLSGVMQASRLGVGEPNVGVGFEFDVIIAVILGGTSLAGGEGSVLGMVIGALIIAVIGNGLNLLDVLSFYQNVIKGFILLLAVLMDMRLKGMIARK